MPQSLFVAFWNLENLFAPDGYAKREPWMADRLRRDLAGWTQQLFERKVAQLGSLIAQMNAGAGPDLLGVCEAENRYVLDALISDLSERLPGRRYDAVHADAARDQRGIDTAFLYDTKILTPRRREIFSHWVMRRTGTRDITQATFRTKAGHELIALANHWPSGSGGGAADSSGYRMTAGETLGYWHERIREHKGEDAAIVALGDFNDDPFDAPLVVHTESTRELADLPRAQSARFYNASWNYMAQAAVDEEGKARTLHGTLYFEGTAHVFDQILLSRGCWGPGRWLPMSRAPASRQSLLTSARRQRPRRSVSAFPKVATPQPTNAALRTTT